MAVTELTTLVMDKASKGEVGDGVAFSTIDGTDGGTWDNGGLEMIIVRNAEAATNTITFEDSDGNADAAITIPASKCIAYGPLPVSKYGAAPVIKTNDATNITVLVVEWRPENTITG